MKLIRLICILTVLAVGSFAVEQVSPPAPPLHRLSTEILPNRVRSLTVDANTAWFGFDPMEVAAWDLKSGQMLWKNKLEGGGSAENISIRDGWLFISTEPEWGKTNSALMALDANTGDLKWSLPRSGRSSAIGAGDGLIYTQLSPFHVSTIASGSKEITWTTKLIERNEDSSDGDGELEAVLVESNRVAVNCGNITYVLSPVE